MGSTEISVILGVNNEMRYLLPAEKYFVGEKELDEKFNSIFLPDSVLHEKEFRCDFPEKCTGRMTARNLIDPLQTPPFLILTDPINFMQIERTEKNIYFPEIITICDNAKYILHGRVYSTSAEGSHFYTVCYKVIDNKPFLVRIDNLDNRIVILTSNMDKARKILKNYPKTVYACYKKL